MTRQMEIETEKERFMLITISDQRSIRSFHTKDSTLRWPIRPSLAWLVLGIILPVNHRGVKCKTYQKILKHHRCREGGREGGRELLLFSAPSFSIFTKLSNRTNKRFHFISSFTIITWFTTMIGSLFLEEDINRIWYPTVSCKYKGKNRWEAI